MKIHTSFLFRKIFRSVFNYYISIFFGKISEIFLDLYLRKIQICFCFRKIFRSVLVLKKTSENFSDLYLMKIKIYFFFFVLEKFQKNFQICI